MEVKQLEIFVPNEGASRIFEVGKEEVTRISLGAVAGDVAEVYFLDKSRVTFVGMPFIAKQ